jgi:uncharacterized protein involved in exopolysaccharide biosynthesis
MILAGAVVAGVAAAILSFVWPPSYQSQALLLITKLRPSVTLDPRFQTVTEENVVNLSVQEEQVRRQTLVGLATSPDLVQMVIDRLGNTLATEERSRSGLLGMVHVGTDGNLITIAARAGSPEEAAAVANAWVSVYAENVNRLYSATSPSDTQMQGQVEESLVTYGKAKQDLEAFIQVSQENELQRKIQQKQQILSDLQSAHLAAARRQLDQLLARQGRADLLALDAQSLRAQLAGAPSSDPLTPGEQLGLFSIEGLAYAQGEVLSATLELAAGWQGDAPLTAGQAVAHLDRLVETLKAESAQTRSELEGLSAALLTGQELLAYGPDDGSAGSIADLQSEINTLEARLEQEQIKKVDLTNARDVAQQSYLTLVRKATEVQITSQLTGVEVQIASTAQAPEEPVFPRPLMTIVLGVVAGALAGLALIVLVEWWRRGEVRAAG